VVLGVECFSMQTKTTRKVIVGMSGGVDSSVVLYLLKKQGFDPIGVSLKYDIWHNKLGAASLDDNCNLSENVCCSSESFNIAKEICKSLNVPYHIIDVKEEFKKEVITYFKDELREGRTPSPCVFCNRNLKFKVLLEQADKFGAKLVATGHYARLKEKDGVIELLRAKDATKDQTYSLCFLPQEYLKKVIFPLGNLTKKNVYKIAKKAGFNWFEKRKQSQDFCFVSGADMDVFLTKEIGKSAGKIIDEKGTVVGKHSGLHFYTIGQRKGINLTGGPYFVVSKDKKHNILIVSKNESNFFKKQVLLSSVSFNSGKEPRLPLKVKAKIRSTQDLSKGVLEKEENIYKLVFAKPQRAITPGQIAVFYDGETCLGGGVIK
jgi:tRNA-specific 2-thiouridylase